VPSVFIIDRSGTIRYVYSNADYTVRLAQTLFGRLPRVAVCRIELTLISRLAARESQQLTHTATGSVAYGLQGIAHKMAL